MMAIYNGPSWNLAVQREVNWREAERFEFSSIAISNTSFKRISFQEFSFALRRFSSGNLGWKMSLLKNLNCHDDLLKEREKILLTSSGSSSGSSSSSSRGSSSSSGSSSKIGERRLSLTQVFNESEVEEWKKARSREVSILRDWLRKQPHLPQEISDRKLLAFLHSCSGSVEQTKIKIDFHYTVRTHAPEIFAGRSVRSTEMISARRITRISPLRHATPEGYNAIFIDCVDPDVENFRFADAMKIAGLAIDVLVHCFPQEKGNVLVFDMKNSVVAHVIKTNLSILKKSMVYAQKALPFKLMQIHVINAFPLIQQIQLMIKPFVDDNLSKMIHIHMQGSMESLYKFIEKKSLPKDYGGEAESLQELNDKLNRLMEAYEPELKFLESLVVDESKREGKSKTSGDVFGMEGSFRKLELD